MTHASNVIDLRPYLPQQHLRTSARRSRQSRRDAIFSGMVAAAEVLAALAIGLCVLLSTGAFLQML